MSTLDLPVRAARPLAAPSPSPSSPSPAAIAHARLRARPFPPEATAGTPYYDEEFDMAQSPAHSEMIHDVGQFLRRIAPAAGLKVLSDNPVWYWLHENHRQGYLYPDYALAAAADPRRATAANLKIALEVVSTERAEKERKDTERMRDRNAANGVPEFGLLYPEPGDPRSLRWFRRDPASGVYRELALPADRRFRSRAVPGLELEVLDTADWEPGRKVRLWYRGARIPTAEEEGRRADEEGRRADEEGRRADEEGRRADEEGRRADEEGRRAEEERALRLGAERAAEDERAARLGAERAAEDEHAARLEAERVAAAAERRAEQERLERSAAEAELARLRTLLQQAGVARD